MKRSALCIIAGCYWAMPGYYLGQGMSRTGVWFGVLAAPLIGLIIGRAFSRFGEWQIGTRVIMSLLSLYAAVALFGLALGVGDFLPAANHQAGRIGLIAPYICVLGITRSGIVFFLWPVAYATHTWMSNFGVNVPAIERSAKLTNR